MASIADPSPLDPSGPAPAADETPAPGDPAWASVAPGMLLSRLTGPLEALMARGVAYRERGNLIALNLQPEEAAQGGIAVISMPVDTRCTECPGPRPAPCERCGGGGIMRDLLAAWLTIPRQVTDGAILAAPVDLVPGAIAIVRFRVLIDQPT
jgi:hypothetical protein